CVLSLMPSFVFGGSALLVLPSFPTRRSSDLALSESLPRLARVVSPSRQFDVQRSSVARFRPCEPWSPCPNVLRPGFRRAWHGRLDRKSTRLNSSHRTISYAVFCLKKKNSQPQ